MAWLHPAALVGLVAVAGPLIVHLLRRQQARRVILPSVRFVVPLDDSAVRFIRPADLFLLLLRVGIIACAALALAQPLLLTQRRAAAWAERIARVVIVDTSDSARGAARPDVLSAEVSSADPVTTIDTPEIRGVLGQASAWLAQAPPARREIVVLSDFQRGSIAGEDIAQIPPGIGVRLVRVTAGAPAPDPPGVHIMSPGGRLDGRLLLDDEATAVTYSAVPASLDGLRILAAAADEGAVVSLIRVVSAAGARAPSAAQPIVIRFPGAGPLPSSDGVAGEWTFGAGQRLLSSAEVVGVPLEVSTSGGALVVDVKADPRSLAAVQVVKAALDARVDPRSLAEHEPAVIPDSTLATWSREPGAPDPADWRQADESDARWLWAAALLLLAAETLVRRSAGRGVRREEAHAA